MVVLVIGIQPIKAVTVQYKTFIETRMWTKYSATAMVQPHNMLSSHNSQHGLFECSSHLAGILAPDRKALLGFLG